MSEAKWIQVYLKEILVALMKIDFHCGDDTSFIHMT